MIINQRERKKWSMGSFNPDLKPFHRNTLKNQEKK